MPEKEYRFDEFGRGEIFQEHPVQQKPRSSINRTDLSTRRDVLAYGSGLLVLGFGTASYGIYREVNRNTNFEYVEPNNKAYELPLIEEDGLIDFRSGPNIAIKDRSNVYFDLTEMQQYAQNMSWKEWEWKITNPYTELNSIASFTNKKLELLNAEKYRDDFNNQRVKLNLFPQNEAPINISVTGVRDDGNEVFSEALLIPKVPLYDQISGLQVYADNPYNHIAIISEDIEKMFKHLPSPQVAILKDTPFHLGQPVLRGKKPDVSPVLTIPDLENAKNATDFEATITYYTSLHFFNHMGNNERYQNQKDLLKKRLSLLKPTLLRPPKFHPDATDSTTDSRLVDYLYNPESYGLNIEGQQSMQLTPESVSAGFITVFKYNRSEFLKRVSQLSTAQEHAQEFKGYYSVTPKRCAEFISYGIQEQINEIGPHVREEIIPGINQGEAANLCRIIHSIFPVPHDMSGELRYERT